MQSISGLTIHIFDFSIISNPDESTELCSDNQMTGRSYFVGQVRVLRSNEQCLKMQIRICQFIAVIVSLQNIDAMQQQAIINR